MQGGDIDGTAAHAQARAQFAESSYVMLALAVLALGFQIVFVLNEEFDPADPWQRWSMIAALLSLFLLFMSVVFGLLLVINRVRGFRSTLVAAQQNHPDARVTARSQRLSAKLERRTWRLFWYHLATFGFGLFLTAVAVALTVIASFLSYGQAPPGCDI
jgi:heme/copper-type cytochrome/quinol oxidase subunit 4